MDHKNREAVFTIVDLRDRITERLSKLAGLSISKDGLSEFACRSTYTGGFSFAVVRDNHTAIQIQD